MKYKLKRDLPWVKAGTIVDADYAKSGNGNISYSFVAEWGRDKGRRVYHGWYPYLYETFSDWFEEVDERWRPEHGENYFTLRDVFAPMSAEWNGDIVDRRWHEAGNCFRTQELAQRASEQIKALLKEFHKNNP